MALDFTGEVVVKGIDRILDLPKSPSEVWVMLMKMHGIYVNFGEY